VTGPETRRPDAETVSPDRSIPADFPGIRPGLSLEGTIARVENRRLAVDVQSEIIEAPRERVAAYVGDRRLATRNGPTDSRRITAGPEQQDDRRSVRVIGSQGRGALASPVPHPPFNPYVRFPAYGLQQRRNHTANAMAGELIAIRSTADCPDDLRRALALIRQPGAGRGDRLAGHPVSARGHRLHRPRPRRGRRPPTPPGRRERRRPRRRHRAAAPSGAGQQRRRAAAASGPREGYPGALLRKHGAADGRFYSERGIDAVIFGPGGDGQHGPDEYVDLTTLRPYHDALIVFLRSLATPTRATPPGP
jgi:hypothetical protein